jgi:hypothetical protein
MSSPLNLNIYFRNSNVLFPMSQVTDNSYTESNLAKRTVKSLIGNEELKVWSEDVNYLSIPKRFDFQTIDNGESFKLIYVGSENLKDLKMLICFKVTYNELDVDVTNTNALIGMDIVSSNALRHNTAFPFTIHSSDQTETLQQQKLEFNLGGSYPPILAANSDFLKAQFENKPIPNAYNVFYIPAVDRRVVNRTYNIGGSSPSISSLIAPGDEIFFNFVNVASTSLTDETVREIEVLMRLFY